MALCKLPPSAFSASLAAASLCCRPVFFVLAALPAMVGPGAILSVALLAPMAMRTGVPVGISPFLIAS